MRSALACALFLGSIATLASASVPPGYYDSAAGLSGTALKAALHGIIDDHTVIAYDDLFPALHDLWEDPSNPANVRLIYGGVTVQKTALSWNREHLWPRSKGVGDTGADTSDLFHIVPCDDDVNSQRSNLYFDNSSALDGGIVSPGHPEAPQTSRDANSWEPPANEKGDIARALFYMAVRYDGGDAATTDIELVNGEPSSLQMGRLDALLQWHASDPPDDAERARNDRIFADFQHNRNPFIDHPEWVASIWGGGPSQTVAQVLATDSTATEVPVTTGTFTIQLGAAAGAGGLTVTFVMSGTAQASEYTLSGAGITFDSITGTGTAFIQPNATVATVVIAPISDGVVEAAETAILTVSSGAGYTVGGSSAAVTLNDIPPAPPPGAIATWVFDAASFPNPLPSDTGAGSLDSSGWTGRIESFSGVSGQAFVPESVFGNGSHFDFRCSTLGWGGVVLNFQTRGTATGFDLGTWSWSIDGNTFHLLPGVNTATRNTSFGPRTVDFRAIPALNHSANVTFRYTLSGATSDLANNRIDNFVINATPLPQISIATDVSRVGEGGAAPVTVTLSLNSPAPSGGLPVSVVLGGTAKYGVDYSLSGVTSFDAPSSAANVSIPAGLSSVSFQVIALADSNPLEFDETVTAQVVMDTSRRYLAGAESNTVVTLVDNTPYNSAWIARFPALLPEQAAPDADPDGDGRTNLEEFSSDANPLAEDNDPATAIGVDYFRDPASGNLFKPFITFSFVRRTDQHRLVYEPQSSPDFVTWNNDLVLASVQSGPTLSTERANYRMAAPFDPGTAGSKFMRLRIDLAP